MNASARNAPRRILALWLPRLPTDRLTRIRHHSGKPADPRPLIVVAKVDNALRISALEARAQEQGLAPGQPLADARAMIPALDVAEADDAADAKLLERIADWCDRFTPFVALDPPHGLFLDITGVSHLFGGETKLLQTATDALRRQGFAVQAAIAGTAVAARALVRHAPGRIVEMGRERDAVGPLPVSSLGLDPAIGHGLRRAGLRTIGQVATRRRSELAARFGALLVDTLDRALGKSEKPISPRRHLPDCMAEHRFAEPVTTQEAIAATLHALALAIGRVLEQRGNGARLLEAFFFRADGQVRRIAIETGQPVRDPAIIARLFGEKLDALSDPLDPGFGFDLIRLEVSHAESQKPEAIGFDTNANAEKEIAFLVDRLAARFGKDRIRRFHPQDTHIPEAESVLLPAQLSPLSLRGWPRRSEAGEVPDRPLTLFAKPEPVEATAAIPDGPPLQFRWRRVLHAVRRAEGPERIAMEWWKNAAHLPTRDYFRVEDSEGRKFWLYRDGLYGRETASPQWYVHGQFG